MESGAGIKSGATVIAAAGEVPSSYHVASMTGTSPPGSTPTLTHPSHQVAVPIRPGHGGGAPSGVGGSVGSSEKKRRGRPRKYGPDGTLNVAFSPMPTSSSAPQGNLGYRPAGGGRPSSSERKQKNRVGAQNLDDWISCSTGGNFLPHLITVNVGEDIATKIVAFSQQGPRAVCVISAVGLVSRVNLRQPNSSGGTLTYEGRFEILSLSGSFSPKESGIFGVSECVGSRSGGMSITLASPDGRVFGGTLAGGLIAAGPVEVVVGSFLPSGHIDPKPRKQKPGHKITTGVATPMSVPVAEMKNLSTNDQSSSAARNQNVLSSSSLHAGHWHMMPPGHEPRKSTADINIPLQGE